mmetsp:Transcript_3116/g.7531  ORF Transcript_3116/g.7531 Transcript_3116/m.7531 type:complete len:88 (-) Transcript_3116:758-1021(-)
MRRYASGSISAFVFWCVARKAMIDEAFVDAVRATDSAWFFQMFKRPFCKVANSSTESLSQIFGSLAIVEMRWHLACATARRSFLVFL